jgi:DNA-binding CsgD family transcriptional regulator/PAS domain-containing protein
LRRTKPFADSAVVELSARLSDRITEDDGWSSAVQELGDAVGGTAVCVHRYDRRRRAGEAVEVLRGLTVEDADEYREHHAPHNAWMERLDSVPRTGQVLVSHHVCPEAELVRHRFYDEFLKPRGLFAMLAVVLNANGDGFETVNILRGRDPGRFTSKEQTMVQQIAPQLVSLNRLARLLAKERAQRGLLCEVLDRISTAVIALAPDLRVVECNRAASELLDSRDGVTTTESRLEVTDRRARGRLSSMASCLAGAAGGIGTAAGASFAIRRPSDRRPLAATIVPVRASNAGVAARGACCLLFVEDLEQKSSPPDDHLIELWQLTRAEARVACLLCAGHSPREIADAREISFNTVRSHIQRILLKTDTARQSDLVRLLTRMGVAAHVDRCEDVT